MKRTCCHTLKKVLYTCLALSAVTFVSCQKEDDIKAVEYDTLDVDPITDPDVEEEVIDVNTYVGEYIMKRTVDIVVTVGEYGVPVHNDLDLTFVSIKPDPEREDGVLLSDNENILLRGTVDQEGLHLQNDTIAHDFTILGYTPLAITFTTLHPIIAPPQNGVLDWTSIATGTGTIDLPFQDPSTYIVTGYIHYHSVYKE